MSNRRLTVTHWGAYELESDGTRIQAVHPFSEDPDPSPIGQSLRNVADSRVMRPSIRRSWMEHGPGAATNRRGAEPFVEVDWDTALDLVAGELNRVRTSYGNEAIFGGSYGWASAGRFHHAQSQLSRFLATIGGYTSKVDTYSHAAAEVIVPHVLGMSYPELQAAHTSWPVMADHTDLIVTLGGIPVKNAQVQSGGHGRHLLRGWMEKAAARGTRFVNISPIRDDLLDTLGGRWLPARPNTDVAIMLGLAHGIVSAGQHNAEFLERYCVGWDRMLAYLNGESDGVPKTPEWAAALSGIPAEAIIALALEMAASRTMINASWSVQRSDHGEQPYWMVIALAAILGQVGLPGGGFGLGYGAIGSVGNGAKRLSVPNLPSPANPVASFIPVARVTDLLLNPGGTFEYNGSSYRYPDTHLVYWCGGNPFHHHQDLNRLLVAWRKPDTVIVHEPFWTATARHADIVLPATTPLERSDLGGAAADDYLFAMSKAIDPIGEARHDYEIFSALAGRLGVGDAFTEGRTAGEWVRHLYDEFRDRNPGQPAYEDFVQRGFLHHGPDQPAERVVLFEDFRSDPDEYPLGTPSGRIELYSETIAAFGYGDCPGHPAWLEPAEWLGNADAYPLHLISNQPSTRLHSQFDHGETSRAGKVAGREPIRIHPNDAAVRGISSGEVLRVFNDRGECLAGAVLDDNVRPGVVQLATGAWYTPARAGVPGSVCLHGNPNVLTRDAGTSPLAQGPTAHTCLVEVARYIGDPVAIRPFDPPEFVQG